MEGRLQGGLPAQEVCPALWLWPPRALVWPPPVMLRSLWVEDQLPGGRFQPWLLPLPGSVTSGNDLLPHLHGGAVRVLLAPMKVVLEAGQRHALLGFGF